MLGIRNTEGTARAALDVSGGLVAVLTFIVLSLVPELANAIPAFARQMGVQCTTCHTAYPQLNAFGREFKLTGYSESAGDVPWYEKFAVMLEPSFTHTSADITDPPQDFGANNNIALTQASLFFGGRLYGNAGAFIQTTYDGVGKVFSWDNTDLRLTGSTTVGGKPIVYGLDANNNPTVQDLWNTTPAWSFPFSSSGIAETPAAGTLIQSLGGQVGSLGAYALWNDLVYLELDGYGSLGDNALRALGVSPEDVSAKIDGVAPYWRLALQHNWGPHYLAGGTFGMIANTYPGGDHSSGNDRFDDVGVDLQYQFSTDRDDLVARVSWIHEHQDLSASQQLGAATNSSNDLGTFNGSVSYLYEKTWGLTVGYSNLRGDADAAYYGTDNGSPDSAWMTFQLDWLPYNNKGGPSWWRWFNPKLSLQYIAYSRFDGATTGASDNDTLYLQAWLVF
jgi:hypothetical protein